MSKDEILNYEVVLFAPDGINSQVEDYLKNLSQSNQEFFAEAIDDLVLLPEKFLLWNEIKHFPIGKIKIYELRVKHKNNICRFFFDIEKPNLIVIYGFTKKTQKTEKRDINQGEKLYKEYQQNKTTISLSKVINRIAQKKADNLTNDSV
jgi:phage-related protein